MSTIGYILLGLVGYLGLKMFSGTSSRNPVSGGIDPATGAKLINTANFMGPTPSRLPAVNVAPGKYYCPFPMKLYKDIADGNFYCYNETELPTQSATVDQTLTLANQYDVINVVDAPPAVIDTTLYTTNATIQDYVQAPNPDAVKFAGANYPPGVMY
jgi:hypothetical protein